MDSYFHLFSGLRIIYLEKFTFIDENGALIEKIYIYQEKLVYINKKHRDIDNSTKTDNGQPLVIAETI